MKIHRLDEVRDPDGNLTHKMCCICFDMLTLEALWVCKHGQKWDMCAKDGAREGCLCKTEVQ